MIFDRKIAPSCEYCRYGSLIDEDHIVCVKRGVIESGNPCRRFRYDPLKRSPDAQPGYKPGSYSDDDFSL